MNQNIQNLSIISQKPCRLIIGLMSGTSFDGLDIALCRFTGSGLNTMVDLLNFETIPFASELKEQIKSIAFKEIVNLQELTKMHAILGSFYAEKVLNCLERWEMKPGDIDLVASHGQTVFHYVSQSENKVKIPNATFQIGDGDHIAVKTQIITLSDFRQKHIASGGQGAPLVIYGDFLLFSSSKENRVMLNIGGISNFTFLPSSLDFNEVFASDIGPGNTLMDQYIQYAFPGKFYDKNAEIARSGKVNNDLLHELLSAPFLNSKLPKTTGPELFSIEFVKNAIKLAGLADLQHQDIMATLCLFTATTIGDAMKTCFRNQDFPVIYMSGGGLHNPLLLTHLKQCLPDAQFTSTESLGFNPDAKEALLFALLANETVAGSPKTFLNVHGKPAISMGKISFPA